MTILYELTAADVRDEIGYHIQDREPLSGDPVENGGVRAMEKALSRHSPELANRISSYHAPLIPEERPQEKEPQPAIVDLKELQQMAKLSNATKPAIVVDEKGDSQASSSQSNLLIKDHFAVSLWFYKGCDGECPICMQSLMKLCPGCESGKTDSRCIVSVGECSHAIHQHCFKDFVSRRLCLVCRQLWVLDRELALN